MCNYVEEEFKDNGVDYDIGYYFILGGIGAVSPHPSKRWNIMTSPMSSLSVMGNYTALPSRGW